MRMYALKNGFRLSCVFCIVALFICPMILQTGIGGGQSNKGSVWSFSITRPDWYEKPSNYSELVYWYQQLELMFPDFIEVFKANELYNTGKVDGGYDVYYVRITNESRGLFKPEVLFLGSPHGDETVGTIGLYWFTHWFMRKTCTDEPSLLYSKDWLSWLLDNREIYIVISQNPFGFDKNRRLNSNGWDLNRESDYDGPGEPTGGIWGSTNGKTLRAFIDNHTIRVGCDFHGGVRMILYPWSSTYDAVYATSEISGKTYSHVPPDFHYFDVSSLRLAEYIGSYGGVLDEHSVGTIPDTVGYEAKGSIAPWAYGANVERHPQEDPFVQDEIFGNYPGTGILWLSPEMSKIKNPRRSAFGNDTIHRYGTEVRRFVLHQTDLAQPYVRWMTPVDKNIVLSTNDPSYTVRWQVNGSLVVDETVLHYYNDSSLQNLVFSSENKANAENVYLGGTGWDKASDGSTQPVTYEQTIHFPERGDYFVVAKAKVDQIYQHVIQSESYEDDSYLRLVQERTNESYVEQVHGSDGIEWVNGSVWWESSLVHIQVVENNTEFCIDKPTNALYVNNEEVLKHPLLKKPVVLGSIDVEVDVYADESFVNQVTFFVDNNMVGTDDKYPFSYSYDEKAFGIKEITVQVTYNNGVNNEKSISLFKLF